MILLFINVEKNKEYSYPLIVFLFLEINVKFFGKEYLKLHYLTHLKTILIFIVYLYMIKDGKQ